MAAIAAHVAARRLRRGGLMASAPSPAGGGVPGVPILTQQFGTDLNLVVEIAWGANPYTDQSSWSWTDITLDVLYEKQISITPGRQDESSTPSPANCQFTVKNSSGRYSQGGQSTNYPNVRKGVPVRVRVFYQGSSYTRFQGYAASFTPGWDTTGRFATVAIVAAGIKRRFVQNQEQDTSALTLAIPGTSPIAYWPLEDGASATQGAAAAGNAALLPSVQSGSITWAADQGLAGLLQAPKLIGGSGLVAQLNPVSAATGFTIGWAMRLSQVPSSGFPLFQTFNTATSGSNVTFGVFNDGTFNCSFASAGTITGAALDWTQWHYVMIDVYQSGGNVNLDLWVDGSLIGSSSQAATLNSLTRLIFGGNGVSTLSLGQAAVWNGQAGTTQINMGSVAFGYPGEYAQDRLVRLASQNGEYLTISSGHRYQKCGPQQQDTFLNLMEATAAIDGGVLYDGFAQGLSYVSHDEMTSQAAAMTLDASLGQLADQVAPIDDDQYLVNEYTASRVNGSSVTYIDTRSTLQPNNVGTYGNSGSIDAYSDGQQLLDFAGWKVNLGTFDKYRFPTTEVWLHRNPELLSQWLACALESRVDITNLTEVRTQVSNAKISLLLEGYSEVIDQFTWSVTMNCTPYEPWMVGEYSQDFGDTNQFAWRVDTDGSTTVATINPGDATCQVATNAGAIWTTNSDDFPVDVLIGGWKVAVTSISGSSSPQTFSLFWFSPLPTSPIPAGSAVSIADVTVIDVLAM